MAITVSGTSITFNDATVQTTAATASGQLQMAIALRTSAINSSGTPLVYNSAGSLTFTPPTGVTMVRVTVIAGGGGGSGGGGTGGNGGIAIGAYTVTPGTGYAITVGAGGAGSAGTGGTGGSSSFSTLATATGGAGAVGSAGGVDGVGSSGNIRNNNANSASGSNNSQNLHPSWANGEYTYKQTSSSAAQVWGISTGVWAGTGTEAGNYGAYSGAVYIEYVG
jgi:hypothetical protein